eukprot:TRINITY_DN15189_c0_g1_i1.p1 TRINITY_DN15189_c0_g1~~TRINITY_DN15189_c0_g1_i1.p1  ORF type:complete len:693 (+),score=151.26 TRINITY_DN15189_c0_g1_i1:187-2265(+)
MDTSPRETDVGANDDSQNTVVCVAVDDGVEDPVRETEKAEMLDSGGYEEEKEESDGDYVLRRSQTVVNAAHSGAPASDDVQDKLLQLTQLLEGMSRGSLSAMDQLRVCDRLETIRQELETLITLYIDCPDTLNRLLEIHDRLQSLLQFYRQVTRNEGLETRRLEERTSIGEVVDGGGRSDGGGGGRDEEDAQLDAWDDGRMESGGAGVDDEEKNDSNSGNEGEEDDGTSEKKPKRHKGKRKRRKRRKRRIIEETDDDDGGGSSDGSQVRKQDAVDVVDEAVGERREPPVVVARVPMAIGDTDEELECPICIDEFPPVEMYTFQPCLHSYCFECLANFLATHITEGDVLNVTCPDPACTKVLEYEDFKNIVKDPEMFEKYLHFSFLSALKLDPNTRWCPRPSCNNAVVGDPTLKHMTCGQCHFEFCYDCKREWHPAFESCEEFMEYQKKTGDVDKKFYEWAEDKKTKVCPKCDMHTEKTDGCNHMTCANCGHQYCWLCLKEYTTDHFEYGNTAGCPGLMFTDENGDMPVFDNNESCCSACLVICCAILIVLLAVLCLPITILLCCCFCWYELCCSAERRQERRVARRERRVRREWRERPDPVPAQPPSADPDPAVGGRMMDIMSGIGTALDHSPRSSVLDQSPRSSVVVTESQGSLVIDFDGGDDEDSVAPGSTDNIIHNDDIFVFGANHESV